MTHKVNVRKPNFSRPRANFVYISVHTTQFYTRLNEERLPGAMTHDPRNYI